MYSNAIIADSFIILPRFPVMERFPFPSDIDDSINNISPPTDVHASPVTTPATVLFSYLSLKNFFGPRTSFRKFSSFELLSLKCYSMILVHVNLIYKFRLQI